MNTVHLIETERDLAAYTADLRKRGIDRLALDMEGDQGSVRYRYSVAILQAFDGTTPVVIDVLRTGNNGALKDFLTTEDFVRVMFSCRNDMFMAQNVLGYSIEHVRDIAVAQKLLGRPVNLADYIGIDKGKKDGFQRANWLRRPIRTELLDYAVNDVLHLLELEAGLAAELERRQLLARYVGASEDISRTNYVVDQYEQYRVKFPGYARLTPEARRLAATVWICRELVGEQFDCPVGYILSKTAMGTVIAKPAHVVERLVEELNRGRSPTKRLDAALVERLYRKAEGILAARAH